MQKVPFLLVFASSSFCFVLFADQVVLKNGDRLTGAIVKADRKRLTLKSEFAGTVEVQWDAIKEISASQPLNITSRNNQVLVGTVTTSDGKLDVQTTEAGKVRLAKDAVQTIRSKEEQAAYEAELERLRKPRLTDFWTGTLDSGLALTRGNARTTTYSLAFNAARTTAKDKILVYSTALYAANSSTGTSVTTAKAVRGGTRYEFNASDRLFAFGQVDLEYDRFQDLDLRNVIGGGLGYHAIKTERTTLDLLGGGAFTQEFFTTGLTRRSGDVLLGQTLSYKLSKATALTESFQFFPNLTQTGEYRFAFDSGIVTTLSKWLSWQATYSDRFLSNPIPGIKKNDQLLTTGIRLSFGKKAS